MGGSSGYRRLKGRSDDFLLQTYRQTDTSPLYIYHHNRHHHPHHHLIIITDHHVDLMMNWVRSLCTHIYNSRRRKKKTLSNRDLKLVLLTSAGSKIIKRLRSGKGGRGGSDRDTVPKSSNSNSPFIGSHASRPATT